MVSQNALQDAGGKRGNSTVMHGVYESEEQKRMVINLGEVSGYARRS
jgi:hypothetical protein